MSFTYTDADIRSAAEILRLTLDHAERQHEDILRALRVVHPSVTEAAIHAAVEALLVDPGRDLLPPDAPMDAHAARACAWYRQARAQAQLCLQAIIEERADGAIINTGWLATNSIWQALKIMHHGAKGNAVKEDFVRRLDEARGTHFAQLAIDTRHNRRGGARERLQRLLAEWNSGRHRDKDGKPSREECAKWAAQHLDMSFHTARRHLRGVPDPVSPAP